jgi:ABC-type histidine transport system ATPase subunit
MFYQYKVSWENYNHVRKELMKFKKIWIHKHLFQSMMVLDNPIRVENVDKAEEEEEEVNFKKKVVVASTGQPVNHMKVDWLH